MIKYRELSMEALQQLEEYQATYERLETAYYSARDKFHCGQISKEDFDVAYRNKEQARQDLAEIRHQYFSAQQVADGD